MLRNNAHREMSGGSRAVLTLAAMFGAERRHGQRDYASCIVCQLSGLERSINLFLLAILLLVKLLDQGQKDHQATRKCPSAPDAQFTMFLIIMK